jgi:hypothetical protein
VILGEAGTILDSDDRQDLDARASPYKGSLFGGSSPTTARRGLRHARAHLPLDRQGQDLEAGRERLGRDAHGRRQAARRRARHRGRRGHGAREPRQRPDLRAVATGTTRAFAKAILGAPNTVLLLGEAGARVRCPPRSAR